MTQILKIILQVIGRRIAYIFFKIQKILKIHKIILFILNFLKKGPGSNLNKHDTTLIVKRKISIKQKISSIINTIIHIVLLSFLALIILTNFLNILFVRQDKNNRLINTI